MSTPSNQAFADDWRVGMQQCFAGEEWQAILREARQLTETIRFFATTTYHSLTLAVDWDRIRLRN